jgi:transposase InsO family protein
MLKESDISERRACELVGIARSSYRYEPHPRDDSELAERLHEVAEQNKKWGYRLAWGWLRKEGHQVNIKRVHRVWKQEGLQQPRSRPRRRRSGDGNIPVQAHRPNHVWTYDFIHDHCENGRQLRMLTLLDEFSRQCLAIRPGYSVTSKEVIEVLEQVFQHHGQPDYIRSDNGSEFIAGRLKAWLAQSDAEAFHIDPGSPWQNAYEESFHGTLRRECLNMEVFGTELEAGVITEQWRCHYNDERPHSSLGYLTPACFREVWEREGRCGVKAQAPKTGDLSLPEAPPSFEGFARPPKSGNRRREKHLSFPTGEGHSAPARTRPRSPARAGATEPTLRTDQNPVT